jgi:uncharacterized protein YjdB
MPPPVDPQSQTAMQIAQMQEQTKLQLGQMRMQNDQMAQQMKAQFEQQKLELEKVVRLSLDPQMQQAKIQTEMAKNDADNQQHQLTELIKNHEDNLTNLEIAKVREQGETDRKAEELYQQAVVDILKPQGDSNGQRNASSERTRDA